MTLYEIIDALIDEGDSLLDESARVPMDGRNDNFYKKARKHIHEHLPTKEAIELVCCHEVGHYFAAIEAATQLRLPLHPDAVKALKRIPETSEYYFWSGTSKRRTVVNIWEDSFHAMFKRAGIVGHSHRLRHTFAVDLLQRGVSLEKRQFPARP